MKSESLARWVLALAMAMAGCVRLADDSAPQGGQEPSKSAWTIGVYTGPSPFQLAPPPGVKNPVLTAADVDDLNVDIVAHPFMVVKDSRYYLFFTAKHGETESGGIGLAESENGLDWKYRRAVIEEPFVVSHPYVFEWQGDYYMIPETYKEPFVRLYRAVEFPDKWEYEGDLVTGEHFVSPTVVRYQDRWWLFTSPPGNETLRLFYAEEIKGPWTEHPQSPIVEKDPNTARPGGRPFVIDEHLYRVAQDCHPTYGNQVHAFQITQMTPTQYAEEMVDTPLVKMSPEGWNSEAMHHVDAHRIGADEWIAAVDALGQ